MRSRLTAKQKRLMKELGDIFSVIGMDYWEMEKYPKKDWTGLLGLKKRQAITGRVVMEYTIINDLLNDEILEYFFGVGEGSIESQLDAMRWWESGKYQEFDRYILERVSLLDKLKFVKKIHGIPKSIVGDVEKLNRLRNVVAHGFYFENMEDYEVLRKAVYKGKDVFTLEGIKVFVEDTQRVREFFIDRLLR